ncbi:hypothetical protein QA649_34425 [Bradyrhizobium sp. CB1717]|uniref:hypothetical protein n=1 Tax=Bradyrhizobium sp. CB1717 TaxID=3039154 RepID=UPI0024B192CB|nr:hypothetical protein [Bradyrhizobium sp. CB1717]WFU23139.1 hypothetical protein QA649_34425 [Bradyrhizobium sp. CB1717]
MPKPAKIGGANRWDKLSVDRHLDEIFGEHFNAAEETDYNSSAARAKSLGPSANKRLTMEERSYLPDFGISPTDPSTWLTDEEAATWWEECKRQRTEEMLRRPMAPTERIALCELALHRGEFITVSPIGKKSRVSFSERLVLRGYAEIGEDNSEGKPTFRITEAGFQAVSQFED